MKFKVKNINLNIYYKYLSLLICGRSSGIFEKLDQLCWKIKFTFKFDKSKISKVKKWYNICEIFTKIIKK